MSRARFVGTVQRKNRDRSRSLSVSQEHRERHPRSHGTVRISESVPARAAQVIELAILRNFLTIRTSRTRPERCGLREVAGRDRCGARRARGQRALRFAPWLLLCFIHFVDSVQFEARSVFRPAGRRTARQVSPSPRLSRYASRSIPLRHAISSLCPCTSMTSRFHLFQLAELKLDVHTPEHPCSHA
jgi:hypothetical protein